MTLAESTEFAAIAEYLGITGGRMGAAWTAQRCCVPALPSARLARVCQAGCER